MVYPFGNTGSSSVGVVNVLLDMARNDYIYIHLWYLATLEFPHHWWVLHVLSR